MTPGEQRLSKEVAIMLEPDIAKKNERVSVTARLTPEILAQIDAMAEIGYSSRSAMLLKIIDVGLQEIRLAASAEVNGKINSIINEKERTKK